MSLDLPTFKPMEMVGKVESVEVTHSSKYEDYRGPKKQLHIRIKPLDKQWKDQHVWVNFSMIKDSAMGKLARQLNILEVLPDMSAPTAEELALRIKETMLGKVFVFRKWKMKSLKKSRERWFPVSLAEDL